jgi:hypothetical protein
LELLRKLEDEGLDKFCGAVETWHKIFRPSFPNNYKFSRADGMGSFVAGRFEESEPFF